VSELRVSKDCMRMDQYFAKVDGSHNFNNDSFSVTKEVVRYGIESGGTFYGIKYFEVEWLDDASPLNLFPEFMRDDLCIRYMMINHAAYPHTDSGILVAVNFYMNTTNEATNFHEIATDSPKVFKLKTQTNGSVFNLNDLKKVCSFVASSGDVYILDVTKIHSVMNEDIVPLASMREAIVVNSSIYDYETIKNALLTKLNDDRNRH
jgi:hypothetical protein